MKETEQSQGHNKKDMRKKRTCGCRTVQNNVAKECGGLNQQLEKEGVLLPTTSPKNATPHKLGVLHHQIEEDIVSINVDAARIRISHSPKKKVEGGTRS